MRFLCTIEPLPAGGFAASHKSREVGAVRIQAPTRDEAIEKVKGEIRYRLELCPCTGETYQHIAVEIVEK
ncbi:MAG TPA: hypothetical protein VFV87_07465 [Pirellulaceae bacterium]|nr:hypothetical protein [Pirellulaceae bacterium]